MANGMMWFGTRDYMTWVPCPAIGVGASKAGWATRANYLNGGAFVRRSVAAAKEFTLSWNLTSRERIRLVSDFADGIYGLGAIYWADPFTMDANMAPAGWGTFSQAVSDGVILDGRTVRPASVPTESNNLGYPITSARYTVPATPLITRQRLWIPIPPGYTLWAGVHGVNGTGGNVTVKPTTGPDSYGPNTVLPMLATNDTTRVNTSVASLEGYTGAEFVLSGSGTVVLTSLIIQLLPEGHTPASGGFISGQGHSGCSFSQQPVLTQQSAALDRVGLSAELVETEQWQ